MKNLITFCITLMLAYSTQAGLLFNYSQLSIKDLDQMNKLVRAKIQESKKSGGDKVIPLKEALQAVFSRSNEDFMIEKLLPQLKNELDEYDAWEKSIDALIKEAIGALKNPRPFKPVVQVTYLVFLENMIAELKPRLDEPFEHKMLTRISDAKIVITKEAMNERRLRVMKGTTSPSLLAESVLKEHQVNAEAKKAAEASAPAPATDIEAPPAETPEEPKSDEKKN